MELDEIVKHITPKMLENICIKNKIDGAKIKVLVDRYKVIVNKVLFLNK